MYQDSDEGRLDRDGESREPKQDEVEFGFSDVIAFTIAAFQIILPILAGFIGVVVVIYLFLRLLAR